MGLEETCPSSPAGVPVCFLSEWGVRSASGLSDHQQPHHDRTTDSGDGSHGSHWMSYWISSHCCLGRQDSPLGRDGLWGGTKLDHSLWCYPGVLMYFSNKYILMDKSWHFLLWKYWSLPALRMSKLLQVLFVRIQHLMNPTLEQALHQPGCEAGGKAGKQQEVYTKWVCLSCPELSVHSSENTMCSPDGPISCATGSVKKIRKLIQECVLLVKSKAPATFLA